MILRLTVLDANVFFAVLGVMAALRRRRLRSERFFRCVTAACPSFHTFEHTYFNISCACRAPRIRALLACALSWLLKAIASSFAHEGFRSCQYYVENSRL